LVSRACCATGLDEDEAKEKPYIASMGIYVFKKDTLLKLLRQTGDHDFGGQVIPAAAASDHKVQAYLFNDYWEDIGTIKTFFEANLALAEMVWP
jgi:glucose-1-phosphate adenylyltransferase